MKKSTLNKKRLISVTIIYNLQYTMAIRQNIRAKLHFNISVKLFWGISGYVK